MKKYFLAVDIGASSGRHILGHRENEKLFLEEIYRFPNEMEKKDGQLCWNVKKLFEEIITGMKKCREDGKVPVSMGIDTWAVDYVLLDKDNKIIGNPVGYRDGRTKDIDRKVFDIISEKDLYGRTGIQKQLFNTVYQLMAVKCSNPRQLERADSLLMIPDYFNFLLTGKKAAEYTNATTTQLLNPDTKAWDMELIERLGYPKKIFQEVKKPGSVLGELTREIQETAGFNCKVILPATHDTGSAVMAVPADGDSILYISSGTWSLMGTELLKQDCSMKSMEHNFTNEGGYDYRFRFLKNITGLWMIQSVRKEMAPDKCYGDICESASKETIASTVNCNDNRFLSPDSMTKEVKNACKESGQQVPEGISQVAAVIYHSLAKCYGDTAAEIEEMTGKCYDSIYILGGGANAEYLNRLTSKITGKIVFAGPAEATAVGNLAAQMIACGELEDLREARSCISNSFEIKKYKE